MIWVIAGTGDSFQIINKLQETNKDLIATVVTEYGQKILADIGIKVIRKRLNKNDMKRLIREYDIDLIIDATHPFASNVSKKAITVSKKLEIEYLRYERQELDLTNYPVDYILSVNGYQEAAEKASQFERIFLTIGSNNLDYFIEKIDNWVDRLIARILPDWKFVKKARRMGFTPVNLLAMQGPFSYRLNRVLLEDYRADVLVTKASGNMGGLETKLKAACDLEVPVIVIKRPVLNYPVVLSDINQLINYCSKEKGDNDGGGKDSDSYFN